MKDQNGLRRIAIICFCAMLVMLVAHIQIQAMFNRRELSVHGNGSGSGTSAYMDLDSRANSTSQWLKRDYPLTEDRTVDLTGQTIDGTLYNNSGDMIRDWQLRVNIAGDCFINQCWTGTVEIHQYAAGSRERVQTLNLQDYALEDVTLEYRYDGDLLIPLEKGDYVIYYPNEYYTEMPIRSGDKVTVGMIFYYLDEIDLSDYDLTMHFHRAFTQGWSFIAFVAAAALWILSSAVYFTSVFTYRAARKQMELRRSSLSYMSELYEAIYIINLPLGEITAVSPGDYVETLRAKIGNAKEILYTAVRDDAEESYLDAALAFVDTDTLAERLQDRDSIVYEFISREHGWCRFRFFAMERTEGKPVENAIFAVQDINDERSELQDLSDRLAKAESVSSANSAFLADASRDLQAPVRELLSLDEQLLAEKDPGKIRECAEGIRGTAERMLALIGGLADRAALEAGGKQPAAERYSLRQLAAEALEDMRPAAERKGIRLEQEIPESIPDALAGDAGRLKETVISLLADTLNRSADGTVRLSVFGKRLEDRVHLLFSVRAVPADEVPDGTPAGKAADREPQDLDLELAGSLLAGMGSGLRAVRSPDAWKDHYFEIEQRIAGSAPADSIDAEERKQ